MSLKFHELRSVRAVVAAGFRVTAASNAVHTSQPGVSRHIAQVEESLGVSLFERRRNRLVGLTSAGTVLVPMIDRVLQQLDGVHRVAEQFVAGSTSLTVATSHTHARYLLPPAVEAFIRAYPEVRLTLRQGYVGQIVDWISAGEADISVSSAPERPPTSLSFYAIGRMHRVILTPPGHPLLSKKRVTLPDLAQFPIITYGPEYAAYSQIVQAFRSRGLQPTMALSTGDTETIKTYATCGLGIAIVASSAFEPHRDKGLRAIDARHLFPSRAIAIGLNNELPLNPHALNFIGLLDPKLQRKLVRSEKLSSNSVDS